MKLRWTRRATLNRSERQSVPFTDAVVAALTAQAWRAGGRRRQRNRRPGGGCSALQSRAFSAVKLSPAVPALSPGCLALIARNLIRRGEDVHALMLDGGAIRLQPIGSMGCSRRAAGIGHGGTGWTNSDRPGT